MAISKRVNKQGKTEYKARYYFVKDGKKRDSETGWFPTQSQALEEAQKLKRKKELEDTYKVATRRDKQFKTVYDEFIVYLEKLYKGDSGTNNDKNNFIRARAMGKKYFPYELQTIKIGDVGPLTFKNWLLAINKTDLGGCSVAKSKTILIKFNHWLSLNGYYVDEYLEDNIDMAIRRVPIKSVNEGNREDKGERNIITIDNFLKLSYYFIDLGIEFFQNFYYYTLFYVLFFGGMRVEELCALKWKNIDLRETKKQIIIENSISEMEPIDKAKRREINGKKQLKNKTSNRVIPIFEFYYELLLDYKESYKYQCGLSYEDMSECYVFPQLSHNNVYPAEFFRANRVRKKLNEAIENKKLPTTDLQMFRHSCAYFLILTPSDGLGFAQEDVIDYFGHTDTNMLKKVYAKLNTLQKKDKMKAYFSKEGLYRPTKDDEAEKLEKKRKELIDRIKGDNEKSKIARQKRVFSQIRVVIEQGRDTYYYASKDKWIIDKYKSEIGENINFVEE